MYDYYMDLEDAFYKDAILDQLKNLFDNIEIIKEDFYWIVRNKEFKKEKVEVKL